MVSGKQYLKSEILQDLIYVPIYLLMAWAAYKIGWIENTELFHKILILGTIAGIITTIVAFKFSKKKF
jgi:hypothetical protein